MPLLSSAARCGSRKDEASPLLWRNGEAEDTPSGDDWLSRWVTCIVQRAPMHSDRTFGAIVRFRA